MEQILNDLFVQIGSLLILAIGGCLTVLINKSTGEVTERVKAIKDDNRRKIAANALTRVATITGEVVSAIQATTAKDIRMRIEEGYATKDNLKPLATEALGQIRCLLEPEIETALKDTVNDIDEYIKIQIETQLERVKSGRIFF